MWCSRVSGADQMSPNSVFEKYFGLFKFGTNKFVSLTCRRMATYAYLDMNIYIYIYTHTHTHIHTHQGSNLDRDRDNPNAEPCQLPMLNDFVTDTMLAAATSTAIPLIVGLERLATIMPGFKVCVFLVFFFVVCV